VSQASLQLGSTKIVLVDTPGFNDTDMDEEEVLIRVTDWIKETHQKGRKFSGLLYLHPINKTREKGSDVRSLKIFKRLVGNTNFQNVVIGMTFCDVEEPEVVASRERILRESPEFWGDMIAAGATVAHISPDNTDECIALVAQMAEQDAVTLQVEDEMCNQNKSTAEITAMEEMQHHAEIKELHLREEMEQAAQKMLYEQCVRLTAEFAAERAALEQKLFEEQQVKQLVEEELLTWKAACGKEKEENEAMKLQRQREEDLRKQKARQKKKQEEAKQLKAKMAEDDRLREEKEDKEHAQRQIQKSSAYSKSKTAVLDKYMGMVNMETAQSFGITKTNHGGIYTVGIRCDVCWSLLPWNEPYCGKSKIASYPSCQSRKFRCVS
jgi:hypothetical protein